MIGLLTFMSACSLSQTDINANFLSGLINSNTPAVVIGLKDNSTLIATQADIDLGGSTNLLLTLKDSSSTLYISPSSVVLFNEAGGTSTGTFGSIINNGEAKTNVKG